MQDYCAGVPPDLYHAPWTCMERICLRRPADGRRNGGCQARPLICHLRGERMNREKDDSVAHLGQHRSPVAA
eukprot:scaffold193026_cov18-Tisochrysis_lutea.AAC.3